MTDKQARFIDEYLIDCNATRAYMVAYPNYKSAKNAGANATRLMNRDDVKGEIERRLEKIHSEKIADATEIMEYLTSVVRGKSQSSVLRFVGDGLQKTMDKPPDEKERLRAAELLGKRYGMFKDGLNLEGVVPVVITNDLEPD